MMKRIDAGTDVAMIGVWDATRGAVPLNGAAGAHAAALERDAADAHLFLIYTGGDGGGPVDLYVDEDIPPDAMRYARPIEGAFLLSLPSGRLVIGGAEEYRSARPRIPNGHGSLDLPPGDYAVRCYAGPDEAPPASEAELKNLVGAEDLAYFDRTNMRVLLVGATTLLLFPALAIPSGWKVALPMTLVIFFAYWPLAASLLKRSGRYQALEAVVTAHRLRNEPPTLLIEVRRAAGDHGLRGGSVRL